MIVIVTVNAVQLQVVVIDVKQAVTHLDVTKTDTLRDHFQRLSVLIF